MAIAPVASARQIHTSGLSGVSTFESALNGGAINLQVGTHHVTRLVDTFAHGNNGEPIAYVGSSGYLEIAVNKANAARTLSLGRGTPVILTK